MKLLTDALLTLLAAALFLVLVDVGLQFAGVKYEASFYRLDRNLGYVLRPGAAGWSVKEHDNFMRISPQGLRDREHSKERAPDVIRIAVVGDSFSEAREVAQQATYWSVMERELNRLLPTGGPRVEVINFGVDGYGLAQEYFLIKERIWDFDPQIVVLTGTLHSFVLRSSRKFGTTSAEGPVPYYVEGSRGLELDEISAKQQASFVPPSRWSDLVADVSNESRVLSLFNAVRRRLAVQVGAWHEGAARRAEAAAPAAQRNFEHEVLRGPVDADYAQAWRVSEDLIRRIHGVASSHHAEFWFILLDMPTQVDPDAAQRESATRQLGIRDLFVADDLFAEFASREGILHAMLARKMQRFAEENQLLLHGFQNRPRNTGHWNETGHRVAGGLIAERLAACSPLLSGRQGGGADAQSSLCSDAPGP